MGQVSRWLVGVVLGVGLGCIGSAGVSAEDQQNAPPAASPAATTTTGTVTQQGAGPGEGQGARAKHRKDRKQQHSQRRKSHRNQKHHGKKTEQTDSVEKSVPTPDATVGSGQ